jgi:hypothetical protein
MKIKELLGDKFDTYGHSREKHIISRYSEKDCIISYVKEKLGTIFIIKGSNKYFAFVSLNKDLYFGGYNYGLTSIEVKEAINLMGKGAIIADKELYGNLNKYLILKAL